MEKLYLAVAVPIITFTAIQVFRYVFVVGRSCKSKEKMDGKTVIITGANTGIGKITAIDLAARGAKVIIACRDENKAKAALNDITTESKSDKVFFKKLNLASLSSVRSFAQAILDEEERLDVLINNAGVMMCPYMLTEDEFEMQFGVNHLAHFLLTMLLLDRIKETPNSRIVVVASDSHYWGSLDFEDMQWAKGYSPYSSYFRSKLANVMFAKELADRLEGTGVSTYSLHPGAIRTELARHLFRGWKAFFRPIFNVLMFISSKTPVQGAQTSIHCAVAKECQGITGKYWSDCALKKPSKLSLNKEDCKRLWDYSIEQVGGLEE